jgi:hypothetical protein
MSEMQVSFVNEAPGLLACPPLARVLRFKLIPTYTTLQRTGLLQFMDNNTENNADG